ncbi:MAG: [protein-PII] uridylyltransferase [Verrucomicrobia bacterium]|nr:MAG: [protein-PII] uridylyltransferase [Verrucomicrobiota bacterium]TAE88698.1 MAG: [protein-PII] uridylyltransferase [Verrucomicrobiota bacterium]TAF26500.1 MAG: [protein-PII] uridylyltransferase [Verrucomicrobiota bacterium]
MSANLKTLQAHAKTALKPAAQGQLSPAERIALYKRFLKIEEHRIKLRHRAGAGGLEIARARAELLDVVLCSLFDLALSKRKEAPVLALVAIGGYGRGTLNPGSDIDLLFLLPRASNKLPEDLSTLIQEILYLLWDVGFKVGHACRSITECLEQAKADQENKTALLEARLLAGDKKLFADFQERFDTDCVRKKQEAFFDLRRQDLRSRHQKYSKTVFLQEPNVKEGCGGMRDYHNIRWVARVKRGSSDLRKLVDDRLLTATALRKIEAAYDFLNRVRNELHYEAGRENDQLTLRLQGVVATNFRYPERGILRKTEAFMRDYYRHTRSLYQHTGSLMESFEIEQEQMPVTGLKSFLMVRPKKREEFDGFVAREGRIYPLHPDIFKEDPQRLMRLFQHCQLRGLRLSPPMRKLVKAHRENIDRPFRYSKANRETFQAILERKGDVARTLRQMHRVGFLGRYLPEFGALDCLVQHEFFHRYTADEHTLRCIEELDALVGSEDPKRQIYRRLFQGVEDPYALYLALILHDTGRAENVREHTDGSAMLASKLCNRLQVHGPRRALIMYLVDHHLTFWRFATTRNIEDPDVVAEFARIVKTKARLDILLLFSYADSNGTNTETWSSWKETLMLQLHANTRTFLAEGKERYAASIRSEKKILKEQVKALFKDEDHAAVDEHFKRMPEPYFRFRDATAVASHVKAVLKLDPKADPAVFDCSLQWLDSAEKGYTELVIATHDRPLLLEKICCALASEELNILSADFYTRNDGVVLDIFRVCTTDFEPVSDLGLRKRLSATLREVGLLEKYEHARYFRRRPNLLRPKSDHGMAFPVRAYVSNEAHPSCTAIEVQAVDRIGLLHDLFHAINTHGLNTANARISTEKGAAMDTIYITTQEGKKVDDEALLQRLQGSIEDLIGKKD